MEEVIRLIGVGLTTCIWAILMTYLYERIKSELLAKKTRSYKKKNIVPDYMAEQLTKLSDEGYKLQTSESVFIVKRYRENKTLEDIALTQDN